MAADQIYTRPFIPYQRGRVTHGESGGKRSSEYGTWHAMHARCYNPKTKGYKDYGGRGIAVCDRWTYGDGVQSGYECFLQDVGRRPSPKHSLDRYPDKDGPYAPHNVRWTSVAQQNRNQRRNKILTALGKSQTITDWASDLGVSGTAIYARLALGWSEHDALSTPFKEKKRFITINGETKSMRDWDRSSGLRPGTVCQRINAHGWAPDEAIKPQGYRRNRPTRGKRITIDGVTKTLREWADESGFSYQGLSQRLHKGCPPEDLLKPQGYKRNKPR